MTPADYLASIVLPTFVEFTAESGDRRRAYLACIVTAHMLDHIVRSGAGKQKAVRDTIRAQGLLAGNCLDVVEAVCNGAKHAGPGRRASIQFIPGNEKYYHAFEVCSSLAGHEECRWKKPGLTIEDNGAELFIDEHIAGLIAAVIYAFPALFPGVDALSLAPWLRSHS